MTEAKLEIYENTSNGKTYKNIALKSKLDKNTKAVVMQGLEDGEFIIIEKGNFAEGRSVMSGVGQNGKPWNMFSCAVKYNGDDVSFILYDRDHEAYADCGGVGDKLKISLTEEKMVTPMGKRLIDKLSFEIVN